jgi:hypothetical protein
LKTRADRQPENSIERINRYPLAIIPGARLREAPPPPSSDQTKITTRPHN